MDGGILQSGFIEQAALIAYINSFYRLTPANTLLVPTILLAKIMKAPTELPQCET